jgi:hypothetical protein
MAGKTFSPVAKATLSACKMRFLLVVWVEFGKPAGSGFFATVDAAGSELGAEIGTSLPLA